MTPSRCHWPSPADCREHYGGRAQPGWRGKLGPFSRCCLHGPVACKANSKPLADMCVALTTLVAGLLGHSGSDTQPAKEDREGGGGSREVEWARCSGARTFDTQWAVHPSFCQPGCLAVQPCRECSRSCSPRLVEQQDNMAWQSQGALPTSVLNTGIILRCTNPHCF